MSGGTVADAASLPSDAATADVADGISSTGSSLVDQNEFDAVKSQFNDLRRNDDTDPPNQGGPYCRLERPINFEIARKYADKPEIIFNEELDHIACKHCWTTIYGGRGGSDRVRHIVDACDEAEAPMRKIEAGNPESYKPYENLLPFAFPPTIDAGPDGDGILDRSTWCLISGPGERARRRAGVRYKSSGPNP